MSDWISVRDRLPEPGKYKVKMSAWSMQGSHTWEDEAELKYYRSQSGHDIPVWSKGFDWTKVTHWKELKSETDKMKSELTQGIIQ